MLWAITAFSYIKIPNIQKNMLHFTSEVGDSLSLQMVSIHLQNHKDITT